MPEDATASGGREGVGTVEPGGTTVTPAPLAQVPTQPPRAQGANVGAAQAHYGHAIVRRTPEERRALLAQQVAMAIATQRARVESQFDFQVVLVTGQKVNHLLHFFIGVFTIGLWWVVWLVLAIAGGEKRHLVQVDDFGNVSVQHL